MPERSIEDLIAAAIEPLFYRRWFSREPIDDRFGAAMVEAAIAAAIGRGRHGAVAMTMLCPRQAAPGHRLPSRWARVPRPVVA